MKFVGRDGQPLVTLCGSGKAAANLALRLGHGQVRTNNVLPLFIGDEIDASLDADLARALGRRCGHWALMKSISHILLVTHKSPSGDYSVVLEAS